MDCSYATSAFHWAESVFFLRRSKQVLEGQGLELLLGTIAAEAFLCPELALLRQNQLPLNALAPFIVSHAELGVCVDRIACARMMSDSSIPAYASYQGAQLLDSVQHHDVYAMLVPISECEFPMLCNELTLAVSPLHIHALDLSFFNSLSAVDVCLHYLISKVLPQRCQGRKFSVVAIRGIMDNNKVAKQLQELVLCSLLGNYSVSDPTSRPPSAIRDALFKLLRSSVPGQPSAFLLMLLQHCRSIVMYCLREQVVFNVDEHPAVKSQIEPLVHFNAFKHIVRDAMSVLRDYIRRMLSTPGSSLHEATFKGAAVDEDSRFIKEIAFLVQPFDAALLKISYRRPKQSFRQFLLSVCNRETSDESEEELPRLVTPKEIAALRELAERISHWRFGQLSEMVRWLCHFRVSATVSDLIGTLMQHHHSGTCSLDRLKHYLLELQRIDPRAFQLLQIAAELIQDTQRVKLFARLPIHYIKSQIDACQDRFGMRSKNELDPAGSVLSHLFTFIYCDVCWTVYSLLADSKSVYKQDYSYGTRDAVADFQTGELYCQRGRHTHRGSCHKQPLKKVLLLGNVLLVNGSMVALCGQKQCGRAFVINSDCVTNARGRCCVYCSQKNTPSSASFNELLVYYTQHSSHMRRCTVCSTPLQKTSEIHVYPHRSYVCRKHHSNALAQYVNQLVTVEDDETSITREEMEASIVQFVMNRENENRNNKVKSEAGKRKMAAMIASATKKGR